MIYPVNEHFLLQSAQINLVKKAVRLLQIRVSDRVLDIACGRGKGSYLMACLHPDACVKAIDRDEKSICVARTLYGNTPNLDYAVGDAMAIKAEDGSFEKALCLEAAFHFEDKSAFLAEAHRLLRTQSRLVLVDIMWKTDRDRVLRDQPSGQLVRDIWAWDDLYSVDQYLTASRDAGFQIGAVHDWTRRVTQPLQDIFDNIASISRSGWGRRVLMMTNPLLRTMTTEDWQEFRRSADAHHEFRLHSKYIALVLKKGGPE